MSSSVHLLCCVYTSETDAYKIEHHFPSTSLFRRNAIHRAAYARAFACSSSLASFRLVRPTKRERERECPHFACGVIVCNLAGSSVQLFRVSDSWLYEHRLLTMVMPFGVASQFHLSRTFYGFVLYLAVWRRSFAMYISYNINIHVPVAPMNNPNIPDKTKGENPFYNFSF